MESSTRALAMMAFATSAALVADVSGQGAEQPVPFSSATCRLESTAGDKVEMADKGEVLTITYDVAIAGYKRTGHRSYRLGMFRILLKEPVVIAADQVRVLFDAIGMDDKASLRPLIQDASGEFLCYAPHDLWIPRRSTVVPKGVWVSWNSRLFASNEAGGATQDIYDVAGGDGNCRPDGALRFLGFEARLTSEPPKAGAKVDTATVDRRKGSFCLANTRLGGIRLPDPEPTLFADAAGVVNPRAGNAIPYALEADNKTMKRHYALLYQEAPGEYVQKIPNAPDGVWFVDDMVTDHRYGLWQGKELRAQGIKLVYQDGDCPLKILRLIPQDKIQAPWLDKYRK